MGSKQSKSKSDDGCIGNQRVRTVVLSAVLVAFYCFGCAYFEANYSNWKELRDSTNIFGLDLCNLFGDCDGFVNAWGLVLSGALMSIGSAVGVAVFFLIQMCDGLPGKICGFILIIGGILYIAGWCWLIDINYELWDSDLYGGFDNLPDSTKEQLQATWAAWFGEALLAGGSSILLGLDAISQIYEIEDRRLGSNLGLIMVVALLCMNCYYLQSCGEDESCVYEADGVAAIATGYLVLWITCLVYVVLYICTCCTCNCKDKCLVRVVLAGALVVGGVITAIGYYAYSGGYEEAQTDPDSNDYSGKVVAYYIGYTMLVAGLPIIWALDIALDDVKNNKNYKK